MSDAAGRPELVGRLRMVDVEPLQAVHKDLLKVRGLRAVQALKKRGFDAWFVETAVEARERVLALVPPGASVGVGGSLTVRELGLMAALEQRGNRVVHHWFPRLAREENVRLRREALACDVYLTGTNAVTLRGQLVNADGVGNRVTGMVFGPPKVVIVAGANKVVEDVQEGLDRIKRVAAPLNALRYEADTPCARTGRCSDCDSPDRICVIYTIVDRRPKLTDVSVVIAGEGLGY